MAEVDAAPRFGAELKDAFKPVNAWVSVGISWLDDIQQFYRERSAIEKEYAQKLTSLARKFHEKKAKKSGSVSVGETPTLTPGSLESASLTTWTTQLTTVEKRAAEHDRFSQELISQVAEPLRIAATRYEELRKSHVEYANKLEKERDAAYVSLKRMKGQYDGACQEVESKRKKMESGYDKAKAQAAYQQQLAEMHNVKNSYIISINITNKQKEKYYHEYVPEVLDSLQDLSETRVNQLNNLWSLAARLEHDTLTRGINHVQFLSSEIPRNELRLDSIMFIRHNSAPWQEPPDMGFEESPVWHDEATMATDETAKVYLRNLLGKSKTQRRELKQEVDKKQREIEGIRRLRQNVREGREKRDEIELVRAMFAMQEDLHQIEKKWLAAEVEASTITAVVGDISIGAQSHNFKSQTFKIPTNCDLCGDRIWGLSAKGFDCRDCGYTCHSKCELKVPADCPGEQTKEEKKRLKAERQAAANVAPAVGTNGGPPEGVSELADLSRSNTMNTLSSGYGASAHRSVSGTSPRSLDAGAGGEDSTASAPAPAATKPATLRKNRIVAPPPASFVSEAPGDVPNGGGSSGGQARGKMLYAYQANGEGELTVDEGTELSIIEADDGSGWMTVRLLSPSSTQGVVPASYVETIPTTLSSPSTSQHPPPSLPFHPDRPGSTYSNNSSASLAGSVHLPNTSTNTTPTSSTSASTFGNPLHKKKGPAVAPKRGARKLQHVEALYDYTAQSEAEWSMEAGERFVLVKKDGGDGWADVERGGVVRSVPASYIQEV